MLCFPGSAVSSSSATARPAKVPVACACQGSDREKLRIVVLECCSALLAKPLPASTPEQLCEHLQGLERSDASDTLPDRIRERLQSAVSAVRQASGERHRGARPLERATQVRQ